MIRILLPFDGSEHALDAVRHVIGMRQAGLEIEAVLLNVQDPPHLYEVVLAPDAGLIDSASHEAGEHVLAPAAALLQTADIAFETAVVTGDAAHEIAEQALLLGLKLPPPQATSPESGSVEVMPWLSTMPSSMSSSLSLSRSGGSWKSARIVSSRSLC